ncbi:hypothetical protein Vafri_16759 [Volvox africanus]|uniref:Alpha/beta hydrolase fold-5 domain-containing protein n=1 Tax=Volvox africanus TaxID=51714 RepID=A0A8J4BJM2_9CHLO|nr:hypothetical protein Vafri_16759 [Volvox africanus]
MKRVAILLLALFVTLAGSALAHDIILPPSNTNGGPEAAMIFIQGAQIPTDRYLPLLREVQNKSSLSLWVGVPQYFLDIAEPFQLGSSIDFVLQEMHKQGLKQGSPLILAGHSLGGAMVQDWVAANSHRVSAQVLLGSFLTRKYREHVYPVPTLTVGAELDGLCRITRIAEAYYHQQMDPYPGMAAEDFPVVVIEGANHMQFASGNPPPLVKARDLDSEISPNEAHDAISKVIVAYLANQIEKKAIIMSGPAELLAPIVSSLQLEGNYNLKKPCYNDAPSSACQVGCPWSEMTSQKNMSDLPKNVSVRVMDEFHPVSQTNPIHLPHILNNCTKDQENCVLEMTTVTEAVYEVLDRLDTGFFSVSAYELRTKMNSRQASYLAAGFKDADFQKLDANPTRCADINQLAIKWALRNAPVKSVARYYSIGRQLVVGDDLGPYNAGPFWIWNDMHYNNQKDAEGTLQRVVRSPTMRTPIPYFIKAAEGFHYCKVLSPARALEWIMVDSLRDENGYASLRSAASSYYKL